MKFHLTFAKFFFVSLFVLGFVLPVTAEHIPQPYKSMNNNIVDWWDEFDQASYSQAVKVDMSDPAKSPNYVVSKMPNTTKGPVIDWGDEFTPLVSEMPTSETQMASNPKDSERLFNETWDWESLQSM